MTHERYLLKVALLLIVVACGEPTDVETSSPEVPRVDCSYDERSFDSAFEYERIDLRSGDVSDVTHAPDVEHIVLVPGHREPQTSLFVWLPGTGGQPSGYESVLTAAAFAGYRTIGLSYSNDTEVTTLCKAVDDLDCSFDVRLENQTGEDVSDLIDIDETDSINARLTALLTLIAAERPGDGWDAFLSGGEPDWSQIVVAGHSQGGGQAAFISHQHAVARAVHFSNPGDGAYDEEGELINAPWTLEARATSSDHIFVLFHVEEGAAARIPEIGEVIGLVDFGAPVGIDSEAPPYACTHVLTTDTPVDSSQEAHRAVAADGSIPRDTDDLPLHLPAWLYLFTASHEL